MTDSGKLRREADFDFESFLSALSGKQVPYPQKSEGDDQWAGKKKKDPYETKFMDQEPDDEIFQNEFINDEESLDSYANQREHKERFKAPETNNLKESNPQYDRAVERIALSHIAVKASFTLEQLLETMIRESASDLHVSTGSVPALRIDGEIVQLQLPDLDQEMTDELLLPILTTEQKELLDQEGDVSFSFDYMRKIRFRVNLFKHNRGVGALFRRIPCQIPKLDSLGLPRVVRNLLRFKKGLILVVGPASNGKTTTLASMINEINRTVKKRIITIEKPVEYAFSSELSLISQREIGTNVHSCSDALFSVLREDPDIIMVSELWNSDEIKQVLKISETGHLVLASMQTLDCIRAIERLVNAFPAEEQDQIRIMTSESLLGIIAQRLVPRADGKGRVLACEILFTTTGLSTIIREGKFNQIKSVIQTGRDLGMQTLDQSLKDLTERHIITLQTAKNLMTDDMSYNKH